MDLWARTQDYNQSWTPRGRDLPVRPLWVNIDHTAVGQLSGATRAEHSRVLWCFFERSNIWPDPSLSRCTSLCCAYQHVPLRVGLGFLRAPAWCSRTFAAAARPNRLLNLQVLVLWGFLRARGWAVSESTRSSPPPSYMSSDRPCPASMEALCWLPLLTSETWSAPWRWALTTERGLEIE